MDFNNIKPIGISVYLEKRRTRILVGELYYIESRSEFEFKYDPNYLISRSIIPLGPELPLSRNVYRSKALFESFADRIPSKENPAYPEYCVASGIDPSETDPIVLLAAIGRRGPSSFVFEPIINASLDANQLIQFRKELDLTVREFAICFSISTKSLIQIEKGKAVGKEVLKRLEIYIRFPEIALFEFRRNSGKIHIQKRRFVEKIFMTKLRQRSHNLKND